MDGIEGRAGVIVVAATNRADLIDTALLRPGRFDLIVELGYPNESERCTIFGIHTLGRPLGPDISLEGLARLTEGRNVPDIERIPRPAPLRSINQLVTPKFHMPSLRRT